MKASELLAGQMRLIHDEIAGLATLSNAEWMARPLPGGNRVGFTAWHMVAVRDWTVRAVLSGKRPLGWDEPFAGTGIARSPVAFGMTPAEADAIAEAVSPAQVVAYSEAVTDELLRWMSQADDEALSRPSALARSHFTLSEHFGRSAYRGEIEDESESMLDWPAWQLLSRPCFGHCMGHREEIEVARKQV